MVLKVINLFLYPYDNVGSQFVTAVLNFIFVLTKI
jgi:hypothetical protein